MPTSVVNIDLSAEIAALPQETFTEVCVIGTADTSPNGADFGELNRYGSVAEVENDYGADADVATASAAVREEGASEWYVIVLEAVEVVDEDVADGASVENTPIHGEFGVTADTRDVVYTTGNPADEALNAAGVAINTATGEIATDDGMDATLTYSHVDWTAGLDPLSENIGRATLADVGADRQHIGDLDSIASFAYSNDIGVPFMIRDGRDFVDDDEAMTVAHEVAGYVPSGNLTAIAHKSDVDVASHVLGQLATENPWFDPFFDGSGYAFQSESFRSPLVGEPSLTNTFEGGDTDGDGPVNVVITKAGNQVLSNSLSTAGASSDYQFFDVSMTEIYLATILENALESLRLREDRIPFTEDGRAMISGTITQTLDAETGGVDDPLADYDIRVPTRDELTDDDRSNRIWSGIETEGTLAGNVHEFGIELTVSV